MNFYALSALINFITSAVLGILVIYKSRKPKNFSFFIFCFFVAFWSFFYYLWQISTDSGAALFWSRVLMAFAIFIPVAYLHFVYALVEILEKRKKFLIFSYFLFSLFLIVDATPYFISHTEPILNFQFWPMAGPFYSLFLGVWFFYVIYSTYLLYAKYKATTGIIRSQIKYVILGMVIGFAGGSTNYFLWYRIPIPPVANILVSVYVGTIAYAIIRYRLMDIRIVVRKFVIYFISAAFAYGFFYLITWLYNKTFGGVYTKGAYLLGLVIAPLFVLFFVWFNNKIKGIANKYLFFSLYTHQETIEKLTDELTNSIDLNKIVDSIVNNIKEAMQLDRTGILLIDQGGERINPVRNEVSNGVKYKIAKVIGFNENNGISLVQDNFLTQYLEKTQKPLVRDELQMISRDSSNVIEKQSFNQLAENMKRIEASLCLPMIISNKLIGIIVLGSKISGDAYTSDDLNLLSTLSKQAAIAVDNARLYREVRDLNENLQQKVDEQTKEIRGQKEEIEKAYKIEKKAHEELKELDEAKTNFMLVTQHHLRTPLTVTAGFLDLLLHGRYGKMSKKIFGKISVARESVGKELAVIDDLLNVSSFQLGRGYVQVEQGVKIKKILDEIVNGLKTIAENKKIYLNFKAESDMPDISADQRQLKMALQNIIDNAIKYTEKGGVNVTAEAEGDKIKIEVKDTGIGISQQDEKHLFEKPFQRSKEAWTVNATGKGIGVYLSAQIIKAHGGKITAESKGQEKGSAFYIELPVKQEINQPIKVENNVSVNNK